MAFISKIKENSVLASILLILKSSVFVQILLFALSPIITRLYTPSDFGLYTVYFSLLSLFSMIVSLRYDIAIPVPKANIRALYLMVIALICMAFLSSVVFLICVGFDKNIAALFKQQNLINYLMILPFGLIVVGVYNIVTYYSVRSCLFSLIARAKIFQGLGMILTQLLLGLAALRSLGLILGTLVGHASGALVILWSYKKNRKAFFKLINGRYIAKIAKRYYKFPLYSTPAILINSLGMYLPAIIFSMLYGSIVAGWYGLVLQAVAAPLGLIGQAVGQVYTGQGANLKNQGNISQLRTLYLKIMLISFSVAFPFVIILFFFGASIFSFIFGQIWYDAGYFSQILSFMLLIEFSVVGPSQNLALLERQDLNLYWNILFTGLIALSFYPAFYYQADYMTTLLYLSIAKSLGYIALVVLNLYVLFDPKTMEIQCVE
jgi:O-antigen/teichoic acid export membrane protein